MKEKLLEFERACFGESAWKSVALSEHSIVVLRDYGYALGVRAGDEVELLRIGVRPEFRGQALGFEILSAFLEEIGELSGATCFLEVASSNTAAIRLYERAGFREISRRRGYYGDDDAIVMRL